MVGTFGVAGTWGALHYDVPRYAMGQGFLGAYFLVFSAILLLPARRAAPLPVGAAPQRLAAWRPWLLWAVLVAGVDGLGFMVWRLARAGPPAA